MKTRITRAGKSTWSILLVIVLLMSTFSVSAVTSKKDLAPSSAKTEVKTSGDATTKYYLCYRSFKDKNDSNSSWTEKPMTWDSTNNVYTYDYKYDGSNCYFAIRVSGQSRLWCSGLDKAIGSSQQLSEYNNGWQFLKYDDLNNGETYKITCTEGKVFKLASKNVPSATSVVCKETNHLTANPCEFSYDNRNDARVSVTVNVNDATLIYDKDKTQYLKVALIRDGNQYAVLKYDVPDTWTSMPQEFTVNFDADTFTAQEMNPDLAKVLSDRAVGNTQFYASVTANDGSTSYTEVTSDLDNPLVLKIKSNDALYYKMDDDDAQPVVSSSSELTNATNNTKTETVSDLGADCSFVFYDRSLNSHDKSFCLNTVQIDTANCSNATITQKTNPSDGSPYYYVKCFGTAKDLVITIKHTTGGTAKIYATATSVNPEDSSKTYQQTETQRYYFAVSDAVRSKSGVNYGDNYHAKIGVWNNSFFWDWDLGKDNSVPAKFNGSDIYVQAPGGGADPAGSNVRYYVKFKDDSGQRYSSYILGTTSDNKYFKFTCPDRAETGERVRFTQVKIWRGDQYFAPTASNNGDVGHRFNFVDYYLTSELKNNKNIIKLSWYSGDHMNAAWDTYNDYVYGSSSDVPKYVKYTVDKKVKSDGSTYTGDDNTYNKIYIQYSTLYKTSSHNFGDNNSNNVEFNIYCIDLPIWATSFVFLKEDGSRIDTDCTTSNTYSSDNHLGKVSSLSLNPNRVYCLFEWGGTYYCRGVVLDENLWKNNSSNDPVGKHLFDVNAVKYRSLFDVKKSDGTYDYTATALQNSLNSRLSATYDSGYTNPLYFGYIKPQYANHGQTPDGYKALNVDPIYSGDSSNAYWTTYGSFIYKDANGWNNFKMWNNSAFRTNKTDDASNPEYDRNESSFFAALQGLVGNKLNSNGQLMTTNNKVHPLFNYSELDSKKNNDSGAYGKVADQVVQNSKFEFWKSSFNGITTYSYDSATDPDCNYNSSDKQFKIGTAYHNALQGEKKPGLFPFYDSSKDSSNEYSYGLEFDIDFYMTSTGYLEDKRGNKQDITFNFSGDDDVWVFLDDVLILDLGGSHKISSASINFSKMKVYYKSSAPNTDDDILAEYTSDNSSNNSYKHATDGVFTLSSTDPSMMKTMNLDVIYSDLKGEEFNNKDDSVEHTLKMFYMERGQLDANCSLSCNLPQATGVTVENDVDFSEVNPGFMDITQKMANKDYFNYTVSAKNATYNSGNSVDESKEFGKVNKAYKAIQTAAGISSPIDLVDPSTTALEFHGDTPLYPYQNAKYDVKRVVDFQVSYPWGYTKITTLKDLLTLHGRNTTTTENTQVTMSDAFQPIKNTNYSLYDDYAAAYDPTTGEPVPDGDTPAAGQTDSYGKLGLLFGQSVDIENKVPARTLVQIKQDNNLYTKLNEGSATNEVYTSTDASGRTVYDYYTTDYTVIDDYTKDFADDTQDFVIAKGDNVKNSDGVIAADNYPTNGSGLDTGFYFTNYGKSQADTNPVSVTANFTHKPQVDSITIKKFLPAGDNSNEVFTFRVEFANVFGDSDSTFREFSGLKYDIYKNNKFVKTEDYAFGDYDPNYATTTLNLVDNQGNDPNERVKDRAYGVDLKAGEYAVIRGIPAGTKYRIREISDAGTKFNIKEIEVEHNTVDTTAADYPVTPKINRKNGSYDTKVNVQGSIPTYGQLGTHTEYVRDGDNNIIYESDGVTPKTEPIHYDSADYVFKYTNESTFYVTFKYYDRKADKNTTSTIQEEATKTKVTLKFSDMEYVVEDKGKYDYSYLIETAYNKLGSVKNLVDDYQLWRTVSEATDKGKSNSLPNQIDHRSGKIYGTNTNNAYHTNWQGEIQDDPEGDGIEKWVNYYEDKDSPGTAPDHPTDDQVHGESQLYNTVDEDAAYTTTPRGMNGKVDHVNVWLFNNLKKYTVRVHDSENYVSHADYSNIPENRKVASESNYKDFEAYYNQRIGISTGDDSAEVNSATPYLSAYGLKGYTNKRIIARDQDNFCYWSFDPEGKYIASTAAEYENRITGDIDLYAVYNTGDEETQYDDLDANQFGLTVYANKADLFFDTDGVQKLRLNTMINPYNWNGGHKNETYDSNMKYVTMVYIVDNTDDHSFGNYVNAADSGKREANRNDVKTKIKNMVHSVVTERANGTNNSLKGWVQNIVITVSETSTKYQTSGYIYQVAASGASNATPSNKNRYQFTLKLKLDGTKERKNVYAFGLVDYDGDSDYPAATGLHISDNFVHYTFNSETGLLSSVDYTDYTI